MKIFLSNQIFFATLGINRQQAMQRQPFNAKTSLSFLFLCLVVILCVGFLFHEANNFEDYIESIYVTSATIAIATVFLVFIWNTKDFFNFVDGWEKCVEHRSQNLASKKNYDEIINLINKLDRFINSFMVKVTIPCLVLPKCVICYYIYSTTEMGNDAFELPLPIWFPFDWKNPIGFLVAAIISYAFTLFFGTFVANTATVEIGAILFLISLSKDIKTILNRINESEKSTPSDRSKIMKQIIEYVQFHSNAIELIEYFVGIFQPIFMVIFFWSLITICGAMMMIQMEIVQYFFSTKTNHENTDLAVLLETIFLVFYAISTVFVACEIGERLSIAYDEVDYEIEQFDWYLFPLEIQRILPTIMINAQQSVELQCFGSTSTNREAFKKVVNSGFSYYTVIRQIY